MLENTNPWDIMFLDIETVPVSDTYDDLILQCRLYGKKNRLISEKKIRLPLMSTREQEFMRNSER